MKHQNFVYKIRSRYIILHTHKQTITKFFFSEEKIPKVLFSFRYTQQGPRNNFYPGGGGQIIKKVRIFDFSNFYYINPQFQGACPFPPQPPCSEAPTYGVNSNQFSVDISFSNLAKSKIQSQKAMYISLCIDFYFYLLFLSNITLI